MCLGTCEGQKRAWCPLDASCEPILLWVLGAEFCSGGAVGALKHRAVSPVPCYVLYVTKYYSEEEIVQQYNCLATDFSSSS